MCIVTHLTNHALPYGSLLVEIGTEMNFTGIKLIIGVWFYLIKRLGATNSVHIPLRFSEHELM
jgi:hypothetical protein